jgi:hypothetical protein
MERPLPASGDSFVVGQLVAELEAESAVQKGRVAFQPVQILHQDEQGD